MVGEWNPNKVSHAYYHYYIFFLNTNSKDKKGAEHWKAGGGDVIVIPKGHCWVEGDNQETSVDSRRYGPVSNGLIFGKVKWVIYPFHRIRKLTSISPQPSHSESTRVIGSNGIPRTYL